MSWSGKYKRSIDCDNPSGFSQKAHCAARKKRQRGEETKSTSPFNEMHEVKSHKSVEQIAKKHRLEVSFIKKQLEMGIPIEHEHTRDKDLATDIALQHLDEIPDYYTRLKKMESDAKKHHKKFKDLKEHCGCEDTAVSELESGLKKLDDTSYDSIDKLMRRIMKKHDMTAKQLHNAFVDKNGKTPDDWIKNQSISEGRRDNKRAGDPGYSLRDWFKGGGWIQVAGKYKGKPCAKQPGQKTKPFCRDADDAAAMTTSEKKKRTAKKRKEDPNPNRKGKAKMVREESCPICNCDPCQCLEGTCQCSESTLQEKKDACYHKVKSRYKVWPSAYASGALVKCRKVGADNWGTKSEEMEMVRYCPKCKKEETRNQCKYGAKYWDMFSLPSKLSNPAVSDPHYHANSPHPGNMPEGYDHEYSMARSEISTIISAAKRLKKKMGKGEGSLEAWVQSKITKAADYLDTAADYVDSGEMEESVKVRKGILKGSEFQVKKSSGASALTPDAAAQLGPKAVELQKKKAASVNLPTIKKESVNIEDANGKHYAEFIDIIKPEPLKPSKGIGSELLGEAGKKCWTGYEKKGTQELFGKKYNRCVKKEEFSDWRSELGLTEDWQSVNRKDKTDGLSQAAVDAYRRENPGSKLQTAVTEKKPKGKRAKRRANFCRRMKGMKDKLTSSKTAKDPDSKINKALRRWRCR